MTGLATGLNLTYVLGCNSRSEAEVTNTVAPKCLTTLQIFVQAFSVEHFLNVVLLLSLYISIGNV